MRKKGVSSDFDRNRRWNARLCDITPTRQASHSWARLNVHVHTLKAPKRKVSAIWSPRDDPRSEASTRGRVERSLPSRNHIKSGIAMRSYLGNRGKGSKDSISTRTNEASDWRLVRGSRTRLYHSGISVCSAVYQIVFRFLAIGKYKWNLSSRSFISMFARYFKARSQDPSCYLKVVIVYIKVYLYIYVDLKL